MHHAHLAECVSHANQTRFSHSPINHRNALLFRKQAPHHTNDSRARPLNFLQQRGPTTDSPPDTQGNSILKRIKPPERWGTIFPHVLEKVRPANPGAEIRANFDHHWLMLATCWPIWPEFTNIWHQPLPALARCSPRWAQSGQALTNAEIDRCWSSITKHLRFRHKLAKVCPNFAQNPPSVAQLTKYGPNSTIWVN